MKVFNTIPKEAVLKNSVVTIGNFDGLHLGHSRLIEATKKSGIEQKLPTVIITFDPHPAVVLGHKDLLPLTDLRKRLGLLEKNGADYVFILPFTLAFANKNAHEFIESFLIRILGCSTLWVGHDFSMGKDKLQGKELSLCLKKYHCTFRSIEKVEAFFENKVYDISSTQIRKALAEGNIPLANAMLGRAYSLEGKVIHGAKRGSSLLGFPTANMDTGNLLLPQKNVYATSALFPQNREKEVFLSISNVGYNPTFAGTSLVLETHLLDFDKEIYGELLEVCFHQVLREEKKFHSPQELIQQLEIDRQQRLDLGLEKI